MNNQNTKDYNWIILFFLLASAVIRFIMYIFDFIYVDYFVTVICMLGLDYEATNIINCIYRKIEEIIDNNKALIPQVKNNKKKKHKQRVYTCIVFLSFYNILLILFSSSVGNDMLSMIVLGITLTEKSIIDFFVEYIKK